MDAKQHTTLGGSIGSDWIRPWWGKVEMMSDGECSLLSNSEGRLFGAGEPSHIDLCAHAAVSDVLSIRMSPVVTGATVIGMKYKDGVILAADTLALCS